MPGNRQSTSEQYVKKSNRRLLLGGLLLLVFFLIALAFMSEKRQTRQENSNLDYVVEDINEGQNATTENDLFLRGDAHLRIEPSQIEMNNVVIGSQAEAVLTLTAENTAVQFLGMEFVEQIADGFTTSTTCSTETPIEKDKSCIVKVLWNPVSLRQIQNNLNIRWKEASPTAFREQQSVVQVKGQSTDSKDCVICENIVNEAQKEPRMAMGLDGKLYEVDEEGNIIIDGKKVHMTENGVFVDEDGNIVAVVEPEYIALNLNNDIMGSISDTKEVIGANGEKFGRMLGDKTIVDPKLTVLGAGIPVVSVINAQGVAVGKMTKEGTVVDGANKVIGKVWVDGQAFSLENQPLGFVRPWGLVANFEGKVIGAIIPDGTVIDGKNNTLGRVMPNGFVIGNQGDLIGATIPQGVGVGSGCQSVGKVLLNGTVNDSFDQSVGTVMLDGTIISPAGEELGSVIPQGLVINEKGAVVGFVNSEGKAVNAKGNVIGCINPDGTITAGKKMVGAVLTRGHVIGYECKPVGTVFPNGEVFDNTLKSVGKVMPDQYVRDADNKIIGLVVTRAAVIANGCRMVGLVSLTGQVLDLKNQPVGCLTPEKTVINSSGEVIGSVAPRGGVYDKEGQLIGRAGFDGKVRDKEGKIVGCVNPDGTVVNPDGQVIGTVAGQTEGAIIDASGNPSGWSRVGNKIYDINGNEVGTLNRDGVVVSETGKYMGFIPKDGTIFSPDGLILGRYSSKVGYAVNQNNERFGKVLFDMTVISGEAGDIIGALIPDNTGFISSDGVYLEKMQMDGTLRDESGNVLGAIRADGSVIDKDGAIIGYKVIEGVVATATGNVIGHVTENGKVVSQSNTEIGHILGNGLVVSTDGKKLLGGVVPTSALAMDATGLVGYLNTKGEIQDVNGSIIGKATPFGLVLADDGAVVARLNRLGVFVDNAGKTIGWTSFEGTLTGKDGKPAGKINALGLAFDRTNKLVGSMVQKGVVVGKNGEFISMVAANNKVLQKEKVLATLSASPYIYGLNNVVLGRVLPTGIAVANDGSLLGWTRPDGSIGLDDKALGTVLFDNHVVNTRGHIIGYYMPFEGAAYNDSGKTVGLVNINGQIINHSGQKSGDIQAGNLVARNGEIIGRLLTETPYVSNLLTGKTNGLAQPNGDVVTASSGKSVGRMTINGFVLNPANQVVGSMTTYGAPVTNALSSLGQEYRNGEIVNRDKTAGIVSGTKAVYDAQSKLVGSVLSTGVVIGKTGTVIGRSSASADVMNRDDKKTAVQMTFGTALTADDIWAGGLMPMGAVVNDDAQLLGVVAADGAVLNGTNAVVGRALSEGAVVRVPDRDLFNTMPYAGAVVAQGMPFSYKGKVLGTTTLNGDVLDFAGSKIFRILDDGTILGKEEPLVGAILPYVTAIDQKGTLMGTLNGQGQIVSSTGEVKGQIAVNETVKGGEFEILGALIPSKTITNECKIVGMTAYNGQVINARGTVMGTIRPDKWVENAAGEKIGRVTRVGLVVDKDGTYLGRTLPDSTVVDPQGVSLGCARNDGTVVDNNGNVIGSVIERGLVLGKDGKPLGRVKANGMIVDKNNNAVGKIRADGSAVDLEGNVIGHMVSRDEELLFDENGNIKGTFGGDGTFRDAKTGETVFRVDAQGNVFDPKGNLIGKYKNGEFTDTKGNSLDGMTVLLDKDGNVFGIISGCDVLNSYGEKIGTILSNGDVVDLNGDVFAKIRGDGTILKDGQNLGRVSGTNTRLDRCGIQTKSIEDFTVGRLGKDGILYDKNGNPIGRIGADGTIYDQNGNVIGKVGQDKRLYDKNGNLIGILGADGNLYDENGNIIGHMDKNGNLYDKNGNLIGRIGKDGVLYDQNGNPIGKLGDLEKMGYIKNGILYDKNGNPIGRVDENGNVYDNNGNLIGRIDKNGNFYDKNGKLIGFMDKNGNLMKFADKNRILYDANGNPIGYIDENGNLYDKDGNLIGRVGADGTVYDLNGNVIGRIDKDGNYYDKDGNLIGRVADNISIRGGKIYDENGNVIGYIDENGVVHLNDEPSAGGSGSPFGSGVAGRAIVIGNQKYSVSDKGSIVSPEGVIIGYMGEDGKPYTLDNRVLTASGDAAGRSRPNVMPRPQMSPEQVEQMQTLLTKKRESMRAGIKNTIKPDGRIVAKGKPKRDTNWKGIGVGRHVSSWAVDMSRMILKDKAIPAVIVRSIDSRYKDVPVTAIVERHIYSEQGRNIIIPAGSRVIGKMSGSPGTDKVAKMEISWTRLIRPDGGAFVFDAVSGDAQGRGGVAAYLDEQLITKYGKPVMTSVVTSAVAYMMAANEDYTTNAEAGTSTQSAKADAVSAARENFIGAMDSIFQQLIQETTAVPPVVFVPSGTRVTIFSNEDLWLRSEEDDVEDYEKENGADTTMAQTPNTGSWVDNRVNAATERQQMQENASADRSDNAKNNQKSNTNNEEQFDYYEPDDSYKQSGNAVTNDVVYSGDNQPTVTEDMPLKERTVQPVLPKSSSAGRLF